MFWFYENPLTLLIMLTAIGITAVAQIFVNNSYKKYKKITSKKGITGFEVARKILDNNGLKDVHVVETRGALSDHYDPKRKVVRLSAEIFQGESIASVAVAAHEAGHALQDKNGYLMLKIRSAFFPIVNFTSKFGYIVIVIGLIFGSYSLAWIGIILECGILVFQLITLPVELNASKIAKKEITSLKILSDIEFQGASKMLMAAAMTYVASLITTLLQILRLILIVNSRRR